MKVSDLILIDHNGTVIEGGSSGKKYNQAAFVIHAAIHHARPDIVAICHSHSLYGSAFASLGRLPKFVTQDSLVFYGDLALYPNFGGVVLAAEESQEIVKYLGDKKAIILQNHGLLTVGQSQVSYPSPLTVVRLTINSVESAAFWFLYLEKVCQMQLLIDASGHEPVVIGEEEARFT
jgi:ribulose-5-phosphate 4-epimerase/fuculose-1-phosphate aldolase